MRFLISGSDIKDYVLNHKIIKASSFLSRISPNSGEVRLDAIQDFDVSTFEKQPIVIKDDSDNTIFTGVTQKSRKSVSELYYILPFKDKWQTIKDVNCTNKTWKNTSLYNIIIDIIGMSGETSYLVEDPDIMVSWFSVTDDQKVKDVLDEIAVSLSGDCYYSAEGVLTITAGFASAFNSSSDYTFDLSSVSDASIEQIDSEFDHSGVNFYKGEEKANSDEVYNATTNNNAWLIPPEGIGVDDDYFVSLTDDVYALDSTVEFDADPELTFVQSVYDSNFQTGSQPKKSKEVQIRITNSSASTKEVRTLKINGKILRKVSGKAVYDSGDNMLTVDSNIIDDPEWAGKLAQYRFEERQNDKITIRLAELDFTPDLGDKFTFDSVRYVLNGITTTQTTAELTGYKDRTSAFVYDSTSITYIRDPEYADEIGDGVAPEAPTNFVLSTYQKDYTSIINADWDASTSPDVANYEVEYKPQGTVWGSASSTRVDGLSTEIEVDELTTYDVRVRTADIEGLFSDWVEDSIKSAQINGDGLVPSASFASVSCTASIINDRKVAHLVWTCSNPDIKQFVIKYSDDAEALKYAITRNVSESWFGDTVKESTFNAERREAYIDIDTSSVWSFILLVEDHDEYVRNAYPSGVVELDFTNVSLEPVPNTPGLSPYSTDEDNIIWRVTSPSNSEIDWKLNLEYKKKEDDWSEAESITITGDEGYRFEASTYFYVKTFVKPSYKDQQYDARVKFINNEAEASGWSSVVTQTVPAAYSISSPNSPTNLVLSTYQSDYKAQISASWTASTSDKIVSYEVEYKKQGVTWSNSASTMVRDATSVVLEVDERLYYDVRVRAVDEYDLNSTWLTGSIKSYDVTGDGLALPNYGFDHSECTASIINERKLAYLVWKPVSTSAPDVKQFIIRYSNNDDINDYAISRSPTGLWSEPSQEKELRLSGDVFEEYIEIDKSSIWTFMLFVEDYDGNVSNYYGSGDDGVIQLDFTNVSTEPTPNTAGLAVYTTDEDFISWTVTAPSNVGKDWKLELQFKESDDDWSRAKKITIAGDKGYQYNPSTSYYVKTFVIPFYEAKVYDGRVRFTNNEDESGSWSTIRQATVPAAYSIVAPNPPTSLLTSTRQSDYTSIIDLSWTASTSDRVVAYEVEYKKQGTAWADASMTTVRDAVETSIEVDENLWYDLRVRSVDEYEQNSTWVSTDVLSYDVVGDGSEPNAYIFDSSQCQATVKNRKRYAKLVWKPQTTASPDIKNFHIRYSNSDIEPDYLIWKNSVYARFVPSNESAIIVKRDLFEAWIEIPTKDTWNFTLIVEDYDGYFKTTGRIELNFSGTTIPGNTPSTAPSLYANTAISDYMQVRMQPPSNVEKDWILQLQLNEVSAEWGNSTYDFDGNEGHQWIYGDNYYLRVYFGESDKPRTFKARARFKDKNGVTGDWSSEVYDIVPISSGSNPSTPTGLAVQQVYVDGSYVIKLSCNAAAGAETYKWYITYGTNLDSTIYFEAETSETEVYFAVESYNYRYNYAHVIASNSYGDSGRIYVSTGW